MPYCFRLLALLFCFALCACARPTTPSAPVWDAASLWKNYEKTAESMQMAKPFSLQGSLRYSTNTDSRRVLVLAWGNGSLPVRLDIMAGIGVTAALIREDADSLLIYAPEDHKAYYGTGAQKSLLSMGMPIPFSVAEMLALLNGRYHEFFGMAYSGTPTQQGQNAVFTLRESLIGGTLTIGPTGLPLRWEQKKDGWVMDLEYDEQLSPWRIHISHPKGYQAILVVKERTSPPPFTEQQMTLTLPEGVPLYPLDSEDKRGLK